MALTPALTLRPVEERDQPLALPARLFCVVHLLPEFQLEWVTQHLSKPHPHDHLLCLCQGQQPPCGLILCRVTSSRRGHVTLSCRLLCLDQSDHRRLGRALLSLAVGLLGASRIEAGIDPKGEWMLPWWRQLGFMPQGSLAVLDDMHKLQGARPREPLAAQAGAHQGGAPEAVGAASHGLVVADPRVLEIQRAFDGVRRTQAANRHWQGRASPLMPANFGPGAVATSVPTSGPGSGAAGTSESQTLRGAKRIKLEEHAFCVYVRRSECAGAGTHVVKVPAQAVLPPNFERWFDPAANVGKRVRDSTQRCRGCGEKFKATLDYAVDIDLDAEIFHS